MYRYQEGRDGICSAAQVECSLSPSKPCRSPTNMFAAEHLQGCLSDGIATLPGHTVREHGVDNNSELGLANMKVKAKKTVEVVRCASSCAIAC